jgi:hypothetical protein
MSTAVKRDIWNAWDRSVGVMTYDAAVEDGVSESTSEFLEKPSPPSQGGENQSAKKAAQSVAGAATHDLRRRRRSKISSNAQIVQWNCVVVNPEIVQIMDASSGGISFVSDRDYKVGTELLVRFPFPSATAPKQKATVVRVEELSEGQRRVAVRLD